MKRIIKFRSIAVIISAALVVLVIIVFATRGNKTSSEHTYPVLHSLHMKTKDQLYQPNGDITYAYQEIWYLAPDKVRNELIQNKDKQTTIIKGNLRIDYANDSQAVVFSPTFTNAKSFIGQTTPSEVLESLDSKGKIDGEKTIAGRKCDSVVSNVIDGSQVSYCIDKKTGIAIAWSGTHNNKLEEKSYTTIFEPDSPIKESVFTPQLPKGMPIVHAPFQSEAISMLIYPIFPKTEGVDWGDITIVDIKHLRDQSMLLSDLQEIAKEDMKENHKTELKALYGPTYIPSRFRLLAVIEHSKANRTKKGWSVSTSYDKNIYDMVEINFIDPKTGDALILIESANPLKSDSAATDTKGFDGKVAVKTDPFPYIYLTWSNNGVFFTLGAVNESKDSLIKVAESMKTVN